MTCQMSVVRNSFIWLLHLLLYRYIDIGQYPEDFMFQSNYWQALIINLPIYASSIDTMVLFHAINHPFIDHLVWSNHIISAFRFVLYHHIDTKDDNPRLDGYSLFRNDTIMIKNVVDVIPNPNSYPDADLGFVTTVNATTQPLLTFYCCVCSAQDFICNTSIPVNKWFTFQHLLIEWAPERSCG